MDNEEPVREPPHASTGSRGVPSSCTVFVEASDFSISPSPVMSQLRFKSGNLSFNLSITSEDIPPLFLFMLLIYPVDIPV